MLERNPNQQIKQYRTFVAEKERESFLRAMKLKKLPSVLGDNQFVNSIKERFFESKRHIEVPESKCLAPEGNRIIEAVCTQYGIDKVQILVSKRGVTNEARSMVIYLYRYLRGESLTRIGKAFNINSYSAVSSAIVRFKARMQVDRKLSRRVEQVRNALMRQEQT